MSPVLPIVEVRHLTKAYTNVLAANDVSFSIEACECFGLAGPNGTGKTSAIEVMEGIATTPGEASRLAVAAGAPYTCEN